MVIVMLLAVIFGLIGVWFLKNYRKPSQQFLMATLLVSGIYEYASLASLAALQMQDSGSQTFACGELRLLENTSD